MRRATAFDWSQWHHLLTPPLSCTIPVISISENATPWSRYFFFKIEKSKMDFGGDEREPLKDITHYTTVNVTCTLIHLFDEYSQKAPHSVQGLTRDRNSNNPKLRNTRPPAENSHTNRYQYFIINYQVKRQPLTHCAKIYLQNPKQMSITQRKYPKTKSNPPGRHGGRKIPPYEKSGVVKKSACCFADAAYMETLELSLENKFS